MWAHCQSQAQVGQYGDPGWIPVGDRLLAESHEAVVSTFMIGKCHLLNRRPSKADKVFAQLADEYSKHSLGHPFAGRDAGHCEWPKGQGQAGRTLDGYCIQDPKNQGDRILSRFVGTQPGHSFFSGERISKRGRSRPITTKPLARPCRARGMQCGGFPALSGFETKAQRLEKLEGDGLISFVEMALPDGSEDKKDKARTRDLLERIASISSRLTGTSRSLPPTSGWGRFWVWMTRFSGVWRLGTREEKDRSSPCDLWALQRSGERQAGHCRILP